MTLWKTPFACIINQHNMHMCTYFNHSFTGSQELHVSAPTNPAFSKFNSLDRRALNKRNSQNSGGNGLLKIATSGPDSLPVRPLLKEPERRHSSYDPKSRPSLGNGPVKQQPQSAININGLPDPFSNKIYSSQESINRSTNNGTPLRPNSSTGKLFIFLGNNNEDLNID